MDRRTALKELAKATVAIAVLAPATLALEGCNPQTAAALAQALGDAGVALANLLGNTNLATQLHNDTTAAVSAILAWKPGSPSQIAVELLKIVEADLNLLPIGGIFVALIELAIGTAQSLISLLSKPSPTPAFTHAVTLVNAPKSAREFKSRWNAICAKNPALGSAKL